MKLFGFEFGKTKEERQESIPSPVVSSDVDVVTGFGMMQTSILSNDKNITHKGIVEQNRNIALQPEADYAVDEIVNEMVDYSLQNPFTILFTEDEKDNPELPKKVRDAISEAFETVSTLYAEDLQENLTNWIVDGSRAWFIQLKKDGKGIHEIKPIDPWLIQRFSPVSVRVDAETQINTYVEDEPYYIYTQTEVSSSNFNKSSTGKKIKLPFDSIVYTDSGKYDNDGIPVSYIRKAMKPINDMLSLENAAIIYRLTRAPEKRAFYVDTGQLPTQKSEEYVKALMSRFKTKLDYDVRTGEIKTANQNLIAATVDYWMPRRGGSASTEIQMISESGNPLNTLIDELNYFKKKAYQALKIPSNRVQDTPSFSMGLSGTIDREEIKFSQFIDRLKNRYLEGLYHMIMVQLLTTGKMSKDEFEAIKPKIRIDIQNNDFFAESKRLELLTTRLNVISSLNDHIGTLFSQEFVFKEVLGMNDEEIETMIKQIETPLLKPPVDPEA